MNSEVGDQHQNKSTVACATVKSGLGRLRLNTDYRTGRSNPPKDFYRPCLSHALSYDRAVGYFRSSVYLVVGAATVNFARRGGKIRLVCSVALHQDDAHTIQKGYKDRAQTIGQGITSDIDALLSDQATNYRIRVLAALVASNAMDVRIAIRSPHGGLYHEKIGVFHDKFGNSVSFIGSANETSNAWHERGNFESIEVFCSWNTGREQERAHRHAADFQALWDGRAPGVSVYELPEAALKRLLDTEHPTLAEVDVGLLEEKIPSRSPLPHQLSAIEAWIAQGRRGVFEHATGSGKTYTALTAAREHVNAGKPLLILVPSKLLLEQWKLEVREEYPDAALILAGAGNNHWRKRGRLKSITSDGNALGPRIVLATMQTAASDAFRTEISGGSHLMIVADEVHQIGSQFNSRSLEIETGYRLGLSATPRRYGDVEGTQRIFDYFGMIVPPSVTLTDAIRAGRLVEYSYHPHAIHLTDEEAQAWRDLSLQIVREFGRQKKEANGRTPLTDRAKMLLIRRSRIAKKAEKKISLASKILTTHFEPGQRWLVYCEDSEHLTKIMQELNQAGLRPVEYHSNMRGDSVATLDWFKSFGGILVSIRCLDEGVDIPAISHALILASSQNPRQFIQRRGRVLRRFPGKELAEIYDAIVVPESLDDEPNQFSLLKSELVRAIEFASSAINKDAGAELRGIALRLGLDPDDLVDDGIEEEEF